MSKFLVVGLGNIGDDYLNTRHNIGFTVLEALAKASNTFFTRDRHADVSECKWKGKTIILVKPTTYMNLSGKAVHYWLQKEKISQDNLLVVTDDIALPFGVLRLKGKGSDGGHNGLKSIQEVFGNSSYARLRFGVGNDFFKGQQVNFVLGKWSEQEMEHLVPRVEKSVEIIRSFVSIGIQLTMTNYNNK